jgi:hypothetical protein
VATDLPEAELVKKRIAQIAIALLALSCAVAVLRWRWPHPAPPISDISEILAPGYDVYSVDGYIEWTPTGHPREGKLIERLDTLEAVQQKYGR